MTKVDGSTTILHSLRKPFQLHPLIAIQMRKVVRKGCQLFFIKMQTVIENIDLKLLEKHPMLREFSNVFPIELPRKPRIREFDFAINLVPSADPISKMSYHMTIVEMQELKLQL